jgi:hypothetical protein
MSQTEQMSVPAEKIEYSWRPQRGPQKALIDCPYPEILFGGARGGGKTDGILGKYALKEKRWGPAFNAVFFRKEMPQQDDLIERAREIYGPTGARWHEQKKQFSMPHGGRMRFRPMESTADAEKYQGQSLSDAAVEEAGNYPMSAPIDRLFGCLRSSTGVPVQLILSANPGGPGHQWIKQRYIDPAPQGFQRLVRILPNGAEHRAVYIPSKVNDNKILLAKDPGYVNRLHLVGSPNLVKAWLEGDWSVIEGAYFPEFSMARHVIAPFEIPAHWARIRAMDWGSAKPFCVHWGAVSDGTIAGVPRGTLVIYREWYGWNGEPNVGCKMTAVAVGEGIRKIEGFGTDAKEPMNDEVLDPSAFIQDGGPSIAERLNLNFRRADNARVARAGAMGGWDQVRERLKGDEDGPGIVMFSTCTHLIRTLPALQHDPTRAEDVDTDGEDHAPDCCRYLCMSRPLVRDKPHSKPVRYELELTINEILKRQTQKRLAE